MAYMADVGDQLTALLTDVVTIAIKVLVFLAIMALAWFVASWLRRSLTRFLRRVGFDRAVERGGLQRLLGSYSASDLAARLVVFAFLLIALQLAFRIFGPNPVSDLIGEVIAWLPRLFVAVVIVVVTAAIAGWIKNLIAGALGGLAYRMTVATAVQVLVLALGVMAALNHLGVATSVTLPVLLAALFTISGVIVVGVGGGLIKPMQHRWERLLNRAETETTLAAEKLRAQRATAPPGRNINQTVSFGQPRYGRVRADEKLPPVETPAAAEPRAPRPIDETQPINETQPIDET